MIACGELKVRGLNILMWLRMLKACNPLYRDIEINDDPETMREIEKIPEILTQNAILISDKKVVTMDAVVQGDVAGVREQVEEEDPEDDPSDASMAHIFVTNRVDLLEEAGKPKEVAGRVLKTVQEAIFSEKKRCFPISKKKRKKRREK